MFGQINTLTFLGLETVSVTLQVHIAAGLPAFNIVGLPSKTIGEARERVRAALSSMGLSLPARRITVNLTPADLTKEGSHFDLPIALGLLMGIGLIALDEVENYLILGELGLNGSILKVNGVLPAAISALDQNKGIICPAENGKEAAWSGNEAILAPSHLLELINHFKGQGILTPPSRGVLKETSSHLELADIKGQFNARRALEIAAAGGHNMLMWGPPGTGKSLLAARLSSILPIMSSTEILETSMINSIAGNLADGELCATRPFRAPHHSCSAAAMVGGGFGKRIIPGEISLAHNGVLFLDELAEFPRAVLEALRQPLETRKITIARANHHITYPAHFQFIAAMNPCRCGYLGDAERECHRAPQCGLDYQNKISGPILDRIDLHVEVGEIPAETMYSPAKGESSTIVATRVQMARQVQLKRYRHLTIKANSELDGNLLYEFTKVEQAALVILNQAAEKFKFSMRGYNRILRIARTIADLAEVEMVHKNHIIEALSFRQFALKTTHNAPIRTG